jgi:hypothetical protein
MEGHSDVLHTFRSQHDPFALHLHSSSIWINKWLQLTPYQTGKVGTFPVLLDQFVLRLCQTAQAFTQSALEFSNTATCQGSLPRQYAHNGERVPMS